MERKITPTDVADKAPRKWTFSHSQISLFRICPARYKMRYGRLYTERTESISPVMEYSKALLHDPIEYWHTLTQQDPEFINLPMPEYWQAQKERFEKRTGLTNDPVYNVSVAQQCLDAYARNPIPGNVHVIEERKVVLLDDVITGEIQKYRYVSKPDVVDEEATNDIKISTSERLYPLKKFDDQFVGQAVCWNRSKFRRYLFQVVKRTPKGKDPYSKLKGLFVEEWPLDDILADNWYMNTIKTIHDIEECQRTGIWTTTDTSCNIFGRECEFYKDCQFGA